MTNLFDVTNDDDLNLDPSKNYLEELVGDNKKFKTPEELARGKAESDAFIKVLNTRADEMRAELQRLREENTTKAKLEELLTKIDSSVNNSSSANTPANDVNTPLYDPKTVESRMYEIVAETKRKEAEQENYDTVVGKLKERFGTNFQTHLREKTVELGLTDTAVEHMARTMPQVLIRSLGLDQAPQADIGLPRSSLRTDQFSPKGGVKRDYAYYRKLRAENPTLYNDPKTTIQRHKDVLEMGEQAFYGNEYEAG